MGLEEWASHNWFSLLQSTGIIGSLLFTGLALRLDLKERRTAHALSITQAHRELWSNVYKRPELTRVLDPNADLNAHPVTHAEEMFILMLVVHLSTSLEVLARKRFATTDEGLRQDIRWFFSLPIPRTVWLQVKERQETGFADFIEACRGKSRKE